jgi:hypothetical protein
MTRPARWKVLAFAAALTGLGMAGAATANAESGSTGDESGVAVVPSDTSWYVGLSESLPPV